MSTFWLLIDPFRPVLVLVALVGPFLGLSVGLLVGYRRHTRGHASAPALSGVQSFGLGLALVPIVLWFATCTPPPGEGRVAHDGKQRGMILLAALDDFHQRTGQYPDSLGQLVPRLIAAIQDVSFAQSPHDAFEGNLTPKSKFFVREHI